MLPARLLRPGNGLCVSLKEEPASTITIHRKIAEARGL